MPIEDIKKAFSYEPGGVYYFDDHKIILDREDAQGMKDGRPCLVISSPDLIQNKTNMVNVIPLSNSGDPDRFCFPISKKYADVADDFNPTDNSLAVIPYYQPLKRDCVKAYCGKLEETTYEGIRFSLVKEVIGFQDYDLDID